MVQDVVGHSGAHEPVGRAPMLGYGGVAFALVWFGLLKRGHLGLRHFVQKAGEGVLWTFSFSAFYWGELEWKYVNTGVG